MVEFTAAPPEIWNPIRQPHVATLQAGANLKVRLGETISSDHNYTVDTFRETPEAPVIVDGSLLLTGIPRCWAR